jgi:hypothetical protein
MNVGDNEHLLLQKEMLNGTRPAARVVQQCY